jgi:2'-5' RNA ligase
VSTHGFAGASQTIPNVRRDFREWHLGRPRYLLWALDVDTPQVRRRVLAAQHHLSGLVLDDYARQPHITLRLCGFPSTAPCHADDFGAEALHTQIAGLQRMRPRPFEIRIGSLSSFTSAPYLEVDDAGAHIAGLRAGLAGGELDHPDGNYTPHVTVGLYADAWPTADVHERLCRFDESAPLVLCIERISLFGYRSADIGGALTRIADYDFELGAMQWHEASPFQARTVKRA